MNQNGTLRFMVGALVFSMLPMSLSFAKTDAANCLTSSEYLKKLATRPSGTPPEKLYSSLCSNAGYHVDRQPDVVLTYALMPAIYSVGEINDPDRIFEGNAARVARKALEEDTQNTLRNFDGALLAGGSETRHQTAQEYQRHLDEKTQVKQAVLWENLPFVLKSMEIPNPTRDAKILNRFGVEQCSDKGIALSATFIEPGQLTILAREMKPLLEQKIKKLAQDEIQSEHALKKHLGELGSPFTPKEARHSNFSYKDLILPNAKKDPTGKLAHLKMNAKYNLDQSESSAREKESCEKALKVITSLSQGEKLPESSLDFLDATSKALLKSKSTAQLPGLQRFDLKVSGSK